MMKVIMKMMMIIVTYDDDDYDDDDYDDDEDSDAYKISFILSQCVHRVI
jgi:hypothetical protein